MSRYIDYGDRICCICKKNETYIAPDGKPRLKMEDIVIKRKKDVLNPDNMLLGVGIFPSHARRG